MNRQIADLQVTRTILLLNLTPSHPKVNEIDLKIGGLRRQVMGELRAERKGLRNKKLEIEYRLREVQAKYVDADPPSKICCWEGGNQDLLTEDIA